MTLKIYNTLTRTKEEFRPLTTGKVRMYVCGPTVYDYIHIGNARPVIFFDVVRRYFTAIGYDVTYVMNFTDVDDKLIRKAEQTGLTVTEVGEKFIQAYHEDARALGVKPADIHPRVTENISEIIQFIERLEQTECAYESGGDVYFRTAKFPDYGKLSHQNLEELQYGIRVEVDERKESAQDFVLWKKAKPGEIYWSSPWGDGRPGWHIECSAMAGKYLGDTLDIHGGGHDLQFPHHECEVAQSEVLTGKPLANYWMHNGYIHINNEKMSKSLGNVINVKELLNTVRPQALRYLMLSTQYRNPLNFNEEILTQAENSLTRINNCVTNINHRLPDAEDGESQNENTAAFINDIEKALAAFHAEMCNDFNTADAISSVFDLVSNINVYMQQERVNKSALLQALGIFRQMNEILGILSETQQDFLDEEIEQLIKERTEARHNKNWARADEIRNLLTEKGIILEDTPQGIRWRRK